METIGTYHDPGSSPAAFKNRCGMNVFFGLFSQKTHPEKVLQVADSVGSYTDFSIVSFTGKETDCETGFSYFGARYYDPMLLTSWTAVDPMADKYPSLSPYNYCAWNPMKLVDPDGMDTLLFDKTGRYQKTLPNGDNIGLMQDKSENYSIKFSFADERWCDKFTKMDDLELQVENQGKWRNDKHFNRVTFADTKFIENQLDISKVNDVELQNAPMPFKLLFAASQSRGNKKLLDFVNHPNLQKIASGTLIITKTKGDYLAHDIFNFGNFLWGAAMGRLGISPLMVKVGSNVDAMIHTGSLDSNDDQRSIWAGYKYVQK